MPLCKNLKTTQEKLKRKLCNVEALSTVSSDDVEDILSSEILVHLSKFLRYFPEISESDL